jgi:hypothetical protein
MATESPGQCVCVHLPCLDGEDSETFAHPQIGAWSPADPLTSEYHEAFSCETTTTDWLTSAWKGCETYNVRRDALGVKSQPQQVQRQQ